MNEKIRQHLINYNSSKGYGIEDADLFETLFEAKRIYSNPTNEHRWWIDVFAVVQIDGMLIGFMDAKTTGDMSPRETGWEFNPKSICEVVAEEVTTTVYKPI